MHDALRRLPWLLLPLSLIAAAYVLLGTAEAGRFVAPLDDAYIHLQYARNLAGGEGITFQAGEGYDTGDSAPLYMVLLAPIYWLAGGTVVPLLWSHLINLVTAAFGVACGVVLAGRIEDRTGVRLVSALVLLTSGAIVFGTMSGMEVGPTFGLFMGAALGIASRRARDRWLGRICISALPLLRPEALALAALYALVDALGPRDASEGSSAGRAPAFLVLVPGVVLLGVHWLLQGSPRTAGFDVKAVTSAWEFSGAETILAVGSRATDVFGSVFLGTGELLPPFALLLVGLAVGAALSDERAEVRRLGWLLAVWGVGLVGLLALNMDPSDHHWRYAQPYIGLLLIACVAGAARLASYFGRREGMAWVLLVAALLCVQVGWSMVWLGRYSTLCRAIARLHFRVADAVAMAEPDARLAVHDAGVIPYVTGRPTIDFVGLGSPGFAPAFRAGRASTYEAIERLDDARYPGLIAAFPSYMPEQHCAETLLRVELGDAYFGFRRMDVCRTHSPRLAPLHAPLRPIPDGTTLVQAIDVADVVSEAAASYEVSEATIAFREAQRVARFGTADAPGYDGGRTIYHTERFAVDLAAGAPWFLVSRVAGDDGAISATASALGASVPLGDGSTPAGEFVVEFPPPSESGPVEVVVAPLARPYLSLHHWVYQ